MKKIHLGNTLIKHTAGGSVGEIVYRDGEPFYRISNYQKIPPFLVTIVSGTEHWMFLSSSGGLTCGRKNPDNALFPYYTDDKIHDANSTTGPKAVLLVEREGRTYLWQPFEGGASNYALECNLYKNLPGNRMVYEEINHDLNLAFSYSWSNGERFGFVKKSRLRNLGAECKIEILDGLRNLLPYGVTCQTQNELSTLLDAYKQTERVRDATAGIYTLSSILTDRAEPCEALKATVAWSRGLDQPKVLLSEDQVEAFCNGFPVESENSVNGKRGAFFVQSSFSMPPASAKTWQLVADVNQGPAQLARLLRDIRHGVSPEELEADVEVGKQRMLHLAGGADGCQLSSDVLVTARHLANTMFNIMRGGTFYDGYAFPLKDFLGFIETWNKPLREKFQDLLGSPDGPLPLHTVLNAARGSCDPDMERLAMEYLPLTFSRRHGDPSRPWNRFSIDIKNADGSDRLHYQGNWRDIFQNWEALSLSYPEYIESFIAKFVNASTADGYNPYRITKNGFDWEVLEPENSWSNIGYWGDHQINYLLKFLELSRCYHPGILGDLLEREIFVYANVPYRINGYHALVNDPRDTVFYDDAAAVAISRRVVELGSDGKLLFLPDGSICRVNLLEKLLVPLLAKIGNFVPGGGIWMNTQRPEWNDANNALVGYGLSMVTLCYMRRYLILLTGLLGEHKAEDYPVSREVVEFFQETHDFLQKHREMLDAAVRAQDRKTFVDGMGLLAEGYRENAYAGLSGEKSQLTRSELLRFIELALDYCDRCIDDNRRSDGLFHSYNLIQFGQDGYEVENLYEMLEGQVAVLSSGFLGSHDSLVLLDSLRTSNMYRSDQNSYMLYPDRKQPCFLDKNVIPRSVVDQNKWIRQELKSGCTDLVEQDVDGRVHFNDGLRNVQDLKTAMEDRPDLREEAAASLCTHYESVFNHHQYTGRSGSMYKYEGLGCIYWHMVSKLLLATSEVINNAVRSDTDERLLRRLFERFDEIKEGLGVHKSPARYGAFPMDPYSHTPGFIGVQQPGMTGQVKEDVIARFAELGVAVDEGRITFAPTMLKRIEFTTEPARWTYSVGSALQSEEQDSGSLAFSVCSVPVIYRLAQEYTIRVFDGDGGHEVISGNRLGRTWSRSLFRRDQQVRKIVVEIPVDKLM